MAIMKYEVEARSFISKNQYRRLIKLFNKKARLIKKIKDRTVYFKAREDLRIREDNYYSYLILKGGKIHDDYRPEIEIKLNRNEFGKLEELFLALGFPIKVKWFRQRRIYQWQDLKVYLDFTKGYGYIIELEKIISKRNLVKVHRELSERLKSLGISITSKKEFNKKFNYYLKNWQAPAKNKKGCLAFTQ